MLRKIIILSILVISLGVSIGTISAQSQSDIPAWVKGVADFWVKGNISDSEFGDSISFLIEQKIIQVEIPNEDDSETANKIMNLEIENRLLNIENKKLKSENRELNKMIDNLLDSPTDYSDSNYLDNGCPVGYPYIWDDDLCHTTSEPECSANYPYSWSDGFCYKTPEYLDNGCHSNYPHLWSDGLCYTTQEYSYNAPPDYSPSCDESYPDVCIAVYPPDLDCDEIIYSNFRVIGNDPHGFDTDYDGIGCEVGSTSSSNTADTTPTCDPSYPDVCITPYPPDLNCGDIGYSNFRVIGSDPHGFDRDNDGIGCES